MLLVSKDYVDEAFPKNEGAPSDDLVFVSCEFRKLSQTSQGDINQRKSESPRQCLRLPWAEAAYNSQYLGCQLQCGLIESKQFDE